MCGGIVSYGIDNTMSGVPLPRSRHYLTVLVCVLVVTVSVSAAPQEETVDIEDITLTGNSKINAENGVVYVAGWQPYTIETTISGDPGEYQVCIVIGPPEDKRALECEEITIGDEAEAFTFQQSQWPENATGQQTVSVIVRQTTSNSDPTSTVTSTSTAEESIADANVQVNIYSKNGDVDKDGVSNQKELSTGTEISKKDTDGDGLTDGKEFLYKSNPNSRDSDSDGLSDGIEVHKYDSNPVKKHSDNDGIPDPKEVNKYNTDPSKPDTDGDGLTDNVELMKYETNPRKEDTDDDGLLDRKEVNLLNTSAEEADSDNDQLSDWAEVKEHNTSPGEWDSDSDGLGDGAEVNKYSTNPNSADTDGDGVDDATEIKQGTDPNGSTVSVFGYSITKPFQIGGIVAVAFLVVGSVVGYRRRRRGRIAEDSTQTPVVGDSSNTELNAKQEQELTANTAAVPEPLTDEDRIQQLLDESGGRLRQSEIVSETDWSKSKVSRLLSRMEDDDQITKITVGRENLITRRGDEPEHAGSTFED